MGPPLEREVTLDPWQGQEIEPPPLRVVPTTELPPGAIERPTALFPACEP